MKTMHPVLSLLSILALVGCMSDKETVSERSAILLSFDADASAIQAAAAEIKVVLNHEVPYTAEGTKVSEWMDIRDHDGDGDAELIISVNPSATGEGELPVVELRPGDNTSEFTVSATGLETAIGRADISPENVTVLSTEDLGPLSFTDEVQEVQIGLRILSDVERPGCDNEEDDDGDGYTVMNTRRRCYERFPCTQT